MPCARGALDRATTVGALAIEIRPKRVDLRWRRQGVVDGVHSALHDVLREGRFHGTPTPAAPAIRGKRTGCFDILLARGNNLTSWSRRVFVEHCRGALGIAGAPWPVETRGHALVFLLN